MPITYNVPQADHPQGLVAIIDIGSNSVRMVVYHALTRVPLPVFNEKYMCALGKGLARTGLLNPEGEAEAERVLGRLLLMAKRLQVASLDILATAAVRDARNGPAFVARMAQRYGVEIRVISGPREAELAGMGVLASVYRPEGISADLGGGSMELAEIHPGRVGARVSCRLGSLRVLDESEGKPAVMEAMIRKELRDIPWLVDAAPACLYAIGGGFRSLAKWHMEKTHYPLDRVHGYRMSKRAVLGMVERLLSLKPTELGGVEGMVGKRGPTLIPTALLLQQLVRCSKSSEVMFSASGIREGFFYDLLSPAQQLQDPLLASASDFASLIGRGGTYAAELHRWMQPLFVGDGPEQTRIRQALCILSEVAWTIEPSFRARWAYDRIMQSSLKGLEHAERILLALALYYRYQTKFQGKKPFDRPEMKLLAPEQRLWAQSVGLAAGLAFQLSGGRSGNLHHASVALSQDQLLLTLDAEASPLRTETVEKRVLGLGEALSALANRAK